MSALGELRAKVLQIKAAHASARPKRENIAWWNTHNDLSTVLRYVEHLEDAVRAERAKRLADLKQQVAYLETLCQKS